MVANFMLMKGLVYLSILPEVEFELVYILAHPIWNAVVTCSYRCGNMQLSLCNEILCLYDSITSYTRNIALS